MSLLVARDGDGPRECSDGGTLLARPLNTPHSGVSGVYPGLLGGLNIGYQRWSQAGEGGDVEGGDLPHIPPLQ